MFERPLQASTARPPRRGRPPVYKDRRGRGRRSLRVTMTGKCPRPEVAGKLKGSGQAGAHAFAVMAQFLTAGTRDGLLRLLDHVSSRVLRRRRGGHGSRVTLSPVEFSDWHLTIFAQIGGKTRESTCKHLASNQSILLLTRFQRGWALFRSK